MWAGLAQCWATVSTQSMSGLHKGHRGGVPSACPVLLHALIQALGAHLGPTEMALGGFPLLTQVRLSRMCRVYRRWDGGWPWTEIQKEK